MLPFSAGKMVKPVFLKRMMDYVLIGKEWNEITAAQMKASTQMM
jgi:hypothetical protein